MSELLIARRGLDLEAQIAETFERLPRTTMSLWVWLPKPRRLYWALRGPVVRFAGDEVEIRDGFEIDLLPVSYSPPTLRWLLGQLGLLEQHR